ncbi:MAG: ABC transporter ATP-binding protein [Sneathiella sp.]|jgi:peptide/nickel transport system ATP-binding protein|uniref:ABC transporter ATP-binding protein n=1 Tax=Sneathiella sp. TaxID=1964365 RepID=UPI000C3E8058|nr:ABC transporter ATP-binding protein [Sneathiella sp.]MAL79342.1 ABC transporter ATP-binding protein [Sneathiella sp.]|tara:strand:+ start:971 stop:2863 length:1893 start_codon:yes stop_codon:yes gene_type:complete
MTNVLLVRDLRVEFRVAEGTVKAVDGVSFRVPDGKTVALVGESGSGKSVISQAIMSILPKAAHITGGEILFFEPDKPGVFYDIAKLKPGSREMRNIRGGRISIIFQEPMTSLSPLHTIGDQISEALHLHHKKSREEGVRLTVDMLRLVGFPDPDAAFHTYPFELSGGLRQRAMIAMAMICKPALLIADEPTTALDVTIQAQILDLMQSLQKQLGMAILLITHDLGVVASMTDEIIVMYHGKVMEQGTLEDIFRNPQHPYLKALMHAIPRFNMAPGERLTPIREIRREADSKFLEQADPRPMSGGAEKPILDVKHLTKRFTTRKTSLFGTKPAGEVLAVDNVSFFIQPGECLGLVGESGCGKTTLSKLILRALSATSGGVTYNDRGQDIDVLALKGQALFDYRKKVQFIFQDPFSSLNPRMTVFDIISEPLVIHNVGTTAEREETVRELMTLVGLDIRHLRRYPHSFSGGQRQRIGIARALALKPDLLICDEPVSALDVSIQAQILNLLKDLQAELGLTYLFISHNLAVVDYIADRIAVMCKGRLVETAPKELLFNNPIHPYTKRLLAAVPEPDPDNRLDFANLVEEKASNPELWPAPFTVDSRRSPVMMDVGGGHYVRVHEETDMKEFQQ